MADADELLERVLAPWIGSRPEGFSRRLHDFVARAAQAAGLTRVALLESVLAGSAPELLGGLIDAATVGHTCFFRHRPQFEHLRRVLPELARSRGRTIELWSAGCATGEEAYSLALCAEEVGVRVRVLATDANPLALDVAREGRYVSRLRALVPGSLPRWEASDALRKVVRFEQASLTSNDPAPGGGAFDLIFCRNVLIYFERGSVPSILETLGRRLSPGGSIVVSPADTVLPLPPGLTWAYPSGWVERRLYTAPVPAASSAARASRAASSAPDVSFAKPSSPAERVAWLVQQGRQDEAEQSLTEQLNQDPDDAAAWSLLGELLRRRGEQVQAGIAVRRAARLKPGTASGKWRAPKRS